MTEAIAQTLPIVSRPSDALDMRHVRFRKDDLPGKQITAEDMALMPKADSHENLPGPFTPVLRSLQDLEEQEYGVQGRQALELARYLKSRTRSCSDTDIALVRPLYVLRSH